MRILVATDQWSPDVVGGSARVAADTARALGRRGHELTVLAPSRRELPAESTELGVEVLRTLGRWGLPQSLADPVAAWKAARRIGTQPFDVLLAHQATNAAGLDRARGNVPLAVVFHASAVLELRFLREQEKGPRRWTSAALDPLLSGLERRSLTRADGILVLSKFSEELVRGRHPHAHDRIHRVTGGVDDTFFAPPTETGGDLRRRYAIPEDALLLFSARRLEPRMGLEELVRAISLLRDRKSVLVLTGAGGLRDKLARLATELGIGERLRLVGRISEIDLRSFYAAADLFVLPTVAYEGFGLSTVEALAQGTPVLGTAVGATPEILQPLGEEFVVGEARPEALAAAIAGVAPLLGPRLSSRCVTLAQAYRWDTAIVAWESALTLIAS